MWKDDDFSCYGIPSGNGSFSDWRQLQPTFFVANDSEKKPKTSRSTSAYALFFRERQAIEKRHSPHNSFGQLSQRIAAQWEALSWEQKNAYKSRCEAKKKSSIAKAAEQRARQLMGK